MKKQPSFLIYVHVTLDECQRGALCLSEEFCFVYHQKSNNYVLP